jgi:hypothetical protein
LVAAIATHHDEPLAGEISLGNLIKVSWRLADVLGYAAFSPKKLWTWEELMAFLPSGRNSWLSGLGGIGFCLRSRAYSGAFCGYLGKADLHGYGGGCG